MKKLNKNILILAAILLIPISTFAGGLDDVLNTISGLLDLVKNLIFALAFIAFFYGLLKFIFSEGEDKEKGKSVMIWGIIALFIMFSIWGIIGILQSTFSDTKGGTDITVPNLPQ